VRRFICRCFQAASPHTSGLALLVCQSDTMYTSSKP